MFYNRLWFDNDKYGLTIGGGQINNPGRYLVLAPADQRCHSDFRNAVFHRESRRSIQSLGRIRNFRLDAEPVHYFPVGVQPSGGERAVLFGVRRCDTSGRQSREQPVGWCA